MRLLLRRVVIIIKRLLLLLLAPGLRPCCFTASLLRRSLDLVLNLRGMDERTDEGRTNLRAAKISNVRRHSPLARVAAYFYGCYHR